MSAPVTYTRPVINDQSLKNAAIIHKKMLELVLSCRPSSVLEVGCGEGKVGAKIAEEGIRYVGIEPCDEPIEAARKSHPSVHIVKASSCDDPAKLNLGKFDLVFSNDVIEHQYDPRRFVSFCKAHLPVGGTIICCTPDYGNYFRNLILSIFNRWDNHHTPLWDGGHIKFLSKKTLGELFREFDFYDFRWGSICSSRLLPMSIYLLAKNGDGTIGAKS